MITARDNPLWLQFWRDQRTDFHQTEVNDLLARFWPKLHHVPGSLIFVPLCGKSLDMLWLADQGHQVIGVELSPVAVSAFFSENGLRAKRRRTGKFVLWQHQNIRILCGDFFALTKSDLGAIDLVYDRASLTALPEDLRALYVAKLRSLIAPHISIFLLTTEEGQATSAAIDTEIKTLFSADFAITLTHAENSFEPNSNPVDSLPQAIEYKVYQLSPTPIDLLPG
jgi:thiopurine S-methyltransferase